jgi:Ulp1 family protease
MVAHRLLDPSPNDRLAFKTKVLDTCPPALRGKGISECTGMLRSFGTQEEKALYQSSTILEHTLDDWSARANEGNEHVTLVDLRGLRFKVSNQSSLRWWVNSRIIDDYMVLINAKARELDLRVCCFATNFIDKFRDLSHKGVKNISTKQHFKAKSVFDFERIIVPMNIGNYHWAFMAAHIRLRQIVYYDSTAKSNLDHANRQMQAFHR